MDNPGKEQTNAGTEHTGRGAGKGAQSVCVLFQEKCRTDEKIYGVQETGPGGQNID